MSPASASRAHRIGVLDLLIVAAIWKSLANAESTE
jgi:hypothetical protein